MVQITQLVLIVVGLWALWYVVNYLNSKYPIKNDGVINVTLGDDIKMQVHPSEESDYAWEDPLPGSPESAVGGSLDSVNWDGLAESQLQGALSKQYQELTSEDLLPHNDMAHWADIYPNGVGQLQNKNFVHSGHHVGINTVGQSLKNPNLQLRSEPPNPQAAVSPWLNSSFGPDLLRRPLEVASGCE